MDRRRQPTCLNMKYKAAWLNECEVPLTKLVCLTQAVEASSERESEGVRGGDGGV